MDSFEVPLVSLLPPVVLFPSTLPHPRGDLCSHLRAVTSRLHFCICIPFMFGHSTIQVFCLSSSVHQWHYIAHLGFPLLFWFPFIVIIWDLYMMTEFIYFKHYKAFHFINVSQFTCFPIDGHLGCLQIFTIRSTVVTNVFAHGFFGIC